MLIYYTRYAAWIWIVDCSTWLPCNLSVNIGHINDMYYLPLEKRSGKSRVKYTSGHLDLNLVSILSQSFQNLHFGH